MAMMTRALSLLLLFSFLPVHAAEREVQGKHLSVTLNQSRDSAIPGARVTLTAQIKLPPGMHVYAPSIEPPYKPIKLTIQAPRDAKISSIRYPEGKKLHLEAIDETVPAYEGTFTLEADALISSAAKPGDTVINGSLNYQTCDDKICYLPVTLPLSWTVKVTPQARAKTVPRK
jgi:DsbC/DsbD-like thiol-disulfide interchange protein